MSDFKTRLLAEFNELTERMNKLRDFIDSEAFKSINSTQQSLLRIQYNAMLTYWECLNQRCTLLTENPKENETKVSHSQGVTDRNS
jgi:hypothetical protein